MNKIRLVQIIFVIIQVIAVISLTISVFGEMDPDIMTVSAVIIWVGMIGNMVCAIIRAVQGSKKK